MPDRPSVSILVPALNEVEHIDACLGDALSQDYPIHEVLVLDGGSTDGTREKVSGYGPPVRLVDNPGRGPASAMNVGIAESTGRILCRMDAHTRFEPDYVARCVAVLVETDAEVVGGAMRPLGVGRFGRAVAAVTSSPAGMPGRFHFARTRMLVDTVYLGAWRRETLERFGRFDDAHFPWWGEDNELNFRIRAAGGRVLLDPSIRSTYFPRETAGGLWRQYRAYGVAKATSVQCHGALPSWRPVAPAALVAATLLGALVGRTWRQRVAVPLLHAGGCAVLAASISSRGDCQPLQAATVLEICHWSFGAGFWRGIGRALLGQPVQVPLERGLADTSSTESPS